MPEAINLNDGGANGGGFPTVGGATYPYGFPVGRNVGHIQLNDDLSWNKGRHTFKAGSPSATTSTPTAASRRAPSSASTI